MNITQSKTFALVGDKIEVILYDTSKQKADEIFKSLQIEALRLQKIFNLYDPKSELSQLNSKRKIIPSIELKEVIVTALEYCAITNGKYDISIGKNTIERKNKQELSKIECSYKNIIVENIVEHNLKNNKSIITLTHKDVIIDLGSIAKGYIGDKLLEFLKLHNINNAFVDMRGDMRVCGSHLEVVNIKHPRTQELLFPFVLENMAVATSGDYNQYHDDYSKSHILNSNNIASVTVVAPSLMHADALATVLFVVDITQTKKILDKMLTTKAMIITTTGKTLTYNNFEILEAPHAI